MKLSYALALAPLALISEGCGSAVASDLDASNPLHCAAQFEGYSILARSQGDERKAKGFAARSQWFAERARALPLNQRTSEVVKEIAVKVAAAPDGGLALATACFERQDADGGQRRITGYSPLRVTTSP